MRPLGAFVLLILAIALLPAAAAAVPVPPVRAAVDPTAVRAVTSGAIIAGVPTTLVATLQDSATGTLVANANLSFGERTTFGWLVLGNATTNAQGEAGVQYEPAHEGTYSILVSYAGNASYAPSNTTLALTVLAAASPPAPPVSAELAIAAVIVAVVGGVWATYLFVGVQVLSIRRIGGRPEDEDFESKERESMEEKPSGAEAPPQRVPGIANANRAVLGLAVAALVLAGASTGLVLLGGLSHTSAYTPSKVSLQVSVLPDFRGEGWDSFVPDELVVHQGDTVTITVYNADTMDHGFAIDAFGVNKVVPAASQNATGAVTPSVTVITFVASSQGAYQWYCTAPCGTGHSTMDGTLVVLPDD